MREINLTSYQHILESNKTLAVSSINNEELWTNHFATLRPLYNFIRWLIRIILESAFLKRI